MPPAVSVPREPERPQPAPPARLQPWVSRRAGPSPRPQPRAPAPAQVGPPGGTSPTRAGFGEAGGGRGAAQVSRTPRCASPPHPGGVPTPAAAPAPGVRLAGGDGRDPPRGAEGADGASRAAGSCCNFQGVRDSCSWSFPRDALQSPELPAASLIRSHPAGVLFALSPPEINTQFPKPGVFRELVWEP